MKLENKVAVITGCARGIGEAIAKKLAAEGARVIASDLLEEELKDTVDKIKENGGEALSVITDVSDKESVEKMMEKAIEEFGGLHILVNNAGINRDSTLHKMSDDEWQQVIEIDLNGVFYSTRFAARYMREEGYGRIINISSGSWLGNFGQANYAAAKAGVVGLTKTASRELARKGVTANIICPGFIDTEMTRGIPDKIWDKVVDKIPAGKPGKPIDVANMVAFLASDEAEYVTGEIINVGGGYKV